MYETRTHIDVCLCEQLNERVGGVGRDLGATFELEPCPKRLVQRRVDETHEGVVDGERRVATFDGHAQEVRRNRIGPGVEHHHVEEGDETRSLHHDLARPDAVGPPMCHRMIWYRPRGCQWTSSLTI